MQSIPNPSKAKAAPKPKSAPPKSTGSTIQAGFNFKSLANNDSKLDSATGNQWGNNASDLILAWLEAHTGWFAKQTILNGCGAMGESWDAAVAELLKDEFIEIHTDGKRWRAKS